MWILAYLNLAAWLYLLLAHGRFWEVDCIEASNTSVQSELPEVCVIIPARNEEDILDKTLPTLLTHNYPALKIILVNDNSEDGTASVATRMAGQYDTSRLTVINGHLRPGWKGKVSAMQSGLDYIAEMNLAPRYILFTDADIAYDKGIIEHMVSHAEAGAYVLTSLMVRLRCKSRAEAWLIPAFVYFFKLLYPFQWVKDASRRTAAAAGGCLLVRYDALLKAGAMTSIRNALIDDCALGRLMKQQGRIWLGLTRKIMSVRPYPHIRDIRTMVARTAYNQLGYSPINLAGTTTGMCLLYILPVWLAFFYHGHLQYVGIAGWLCMSFTFLPMIRFYNRPQLLSMALPVIAVFYMLFTLDSAIQYWNGKGGLWKGRAQAMDTLL